MPKKIAQFSNVLRGRKIICGYKLSRENTTVCNTGVREIRNMSNLLRGIKAARPMLDKGVRRHARNGKLVSFWNDRWIESYPLKNWVDIDQIRGQMENKVVDYWQQVEGWMWEELSDILPEDVIEKLNLYILNSDEESKDEIFWMLENS